MSQVPPGVHFPTSEGVRSSLQTGADVIADSVSGVNVELAATVRASTRWRHDYVEAFAASTRASVRTQASISIAEDGLRAAWDRLVMVDPDGSETPVSKWVASGDGQDRELGTANVRGTQERVRRLEVPYRGHVLHGASLLRQLQDWVARGVVEPGFAAAIEQVMEHPEWLPMPGHQVVLIGAAAAMGPLASLCEWGAEVVAIDVPVPAVAHRVRTIAAGGAGSVQMPFDAETGVPGAHVSSDLGALRAWLSQVSRPDVTPVVAAQAYADGAAHVAVNVASDVLTQDVVAQRPDAVLAFLNTPTDSFLVPTEAVQHARERASSMRWNGPAHRAAAMLTGRRLFRPAYINTYGDDEGRTWGLSDTLVNVQGPNYALAKRLQRWRAVVAQHAGIRVSSTVAPASWTRSVTKNKILASVYAGASPFGVEIFEPETARVLMAAKLAADTFRDRSTWGAHPESVFADAAHGGLWRQPFEPRSALGVAALLGAPRNALRSRG